MLDWYTLQKAAEWLNKNNSVDHWCDDEILQAAVDEKLEIFSNVLASDQVTIFTRREHLKARKFTLSKSNRYPPTEEGALCEMEERQKALDQLRKKYSADSPEVLSAEQSPCGLIHLDSNLVPVPAAVVGRLLIGPNVSIDQRLLRSDAFNYFQLSKPKEISLTRESLRISSRDLKEFAADTAASGAKADLKNMDNPPAISRTDKKAETQEKYKKLQDDLNKLAADWEKENSRTLSHSKACTDFASSLNQTAANLRRRTRKDW